MSLSIRPSPVLFTLLLLFLQPGLFDAWPHFHRVHHECQGEIILRRLNAFLQGGSDNSLFNQVSNFFRGKYMSANVRKTMECLDTVFLDIKNDFKQLKYSIKLLHVQQAMINTLLEARRIMDNIYTVYVSLADYRAHREFFTHRELIRKCERNEPSESLQMLYLRSVTEPRLFDTILLGTEYSTDDFERISNTWLKQAAMCAILARECVFVRPSNASKAFQNRLNQRILRQLEGIRDAYLLARNNMAISFIVTIPNIIRRELNLIASNGFDLTAGVNQIYNTLTSKFPFRAWAVMLYDRVDINQTELHAYESSTNNSFFVNDAQHTVVVHSADRSLNCSLFLTIIRQHRLRRFFANDDEYAIFLTRRGQLGNDIVTIRSLLLENESFVPQNYFISVVRYYGPLNGVAEKHESDFHHFEHMFHPRTKKPKKSVLIGWC